MSFRTSSKADDRQRTVYWVGESGVMQRIYPCRCGKTHRGDYALYDYEHHNCFHSEPLMRFGDMEDWYVCGECGETFTSVLVKEG